MEVRFPHAAIITIPQAVFDPSAKHRRQGVNASSAETSLHSRSDSIAADQPLEATHGSRSSGSAITGRPAEVRAPVPGTAHIRLEDLRRSESPSPASHAGQPLAGTQTAASSEQEVPAAPDNSQAAIPKRIPDLARIIRYTKNDKLPAGVKNTPYDQHVDAVEQKVLPYVGPWHTPEAAKAAAALLADHMGQVYDTAMAAFATHPEWKTFTIQLVIGMYFSQLEWTREDTSNPQAEYEAVVRERMQGSESSEVFPGLKLKHRPPITPNPTVPPVTLPGTPTVDRVAPLLPVTPIPLPLLSPFTPSLKKLTISQKNDAVLRKELNRLLKTARTRSNPKVYYWNEPALEFAEDAIFGQKWTLSPKFIEAISSPLWDRDVDFQPSWLNCPTGTRKPLEQGPVRARICLHAAPSSHFRLNSMYKRSPQLSKVRSKGTCRKSDTPSAKNLGFPTVTTKLMRTIRRTSLGTSARSQHGPARTQTRRSWQE